MDTRGLTQPQYQLLQKLSPWMTHNGFYLAGGTALTLYFGHRQSVDLDWFTSNVMGDGMVLAQQIGETVPLNISQVAPGTLHAVANEVRLSLLEYRYTLLQPMTIWTEMDCHLASLDDLASMKLSAIAQRGARKDFLDVYQLINRHKPLPELLNLYRQKFRTDDVMPVLYGLTYFADADQEPQPLLCKDDWKTVKQAFQSWVRNIR